MPLLDGEAHSLVLSVSDTYGAVGQATVPIFIDRVAPRCDVASPLDGGLLAVSSVDVQLRVTDGSGRYGQAGLSTDQGASWQETPLVQGQARFHVPLPTDFEGTLPLHLRGADGAGNECSTQLELRVDTRGPTVTPQVPSASAIIGRQAGTFSVSFLVADGSGLASAEVLAPPSAQWRPAQVQAGVATFSWSPPAGDDGVAETLQLRATDLAGNVTTVPVAVTVDQVAPQCTLVTPTTGSTFNRASGSSTSVQWSIVDGSQGGASTSVSVDDGQTWVAVVPGAGGAAQYTWSFSPSLNGDAVTVRVRGADAAGNPCVEQSATVTVDEVAPTLRVSAPVANALVGTPTFVASGIANDGANPVDSVTVDFGDGAGPRLAGLTGSTWSVVIPTNASDDAQLHALTIDAVDTAGNHTSVTRRLRVDRVAPVLAIQSPLDGALIGSAQVASDGSVGLQVQATDGDPGLVVELNTGSGWVPVSGGTASLPTSATDDGKAYTFSVRATDSAGHTTQQSRSLTVDRVAPSLTVATPSNNTFINAASVSCTGTASDGSGTLLVTVDFGDGQGPRKASAAGPTWNVVVPTVASEDAKAHVVAVVASDAAGNQTSTSRTITVDRVAPTLNVLAPTEGALLGLAQLATHGDVGLQVQATDGDAALVTEVSTASGWVGFTGTTGWPTSASDDGAPYSVAVRAKDTAGNTTQVIRSFRVDRVAPTVVSTTPVNGARGTDLSFGAQFSEPIAVSGASVPVTFTPAAGGTWSLDATAKVLSVAGLGGDTTYSATLSAARLSDLAGNVMAPLSAVSFTTRVARPANGATLIAATASQQVEWFRASVDDDGVIALVVRVINPSTKVRAWLLGWVDTVTGAWRLQDTRPASQTGATLHSFSEQVAGQPRHRASIWFGNSGNGAYFTLGTAGSVATSSLSFAVPPGSGVAANSDLGNFSYDSVAGTYSYLRPPSLALTVSASKPSSIGYASPDNWSVVTSWAPTIWSAGGSSISHHACACSGSCMCTQSSEVLLPGLSPACRSGLPCPLPDTSYDTIVRTRSTDWLLAHRMELSPSDLTTETWASVTLVRLTDGSTTPVTVPFSDDVAIAPSGNPDEVVIANGLENGWFNPMTEVSLSLGNATSPVTGGPEVKRLVVAPIAVFDDPGAADHTHHAFSPVGGGLLGLLYVTTTGELRYAE
jgi:hypothetical protein